MMTGTSARAWRSGWRTKAWRIASASDGLEALAALQREGGRWLVLLDLRMPRLDGWGLLDRLQDDATVQADPQVVLMSAGRVLAQVHALTSAASGEQQ